MRAIIAIIAKDLKLRLRDRSALVIAFVAPFMISLIISFAFGGGGNEFNADLAVADEDGGTFARSMIEGVSSAPGLKDAITFKQVQTSAEAKKLASDGDVSAAIVFPAGFGKAVAEGASAKIAVYRFAGSTIGADVAEAIARSTVDEINAGRLAVQTALGTTPARPDQIAKLVEKASSTRVPLAVVEGKLGNREVKPSSYFGPSMSIFFLFFTVQFGALSILQERATGTLRRIAASPLTPWSVIVGKIGASFILGITSLGVMVIATTKLLGASWGDPLAVAVMAIAIVLAASSVTALAVSFAGTVEQAQGFASIATLVLAMLGGNFIPIAQSPPLIQKLSLLTPNGWALRAFTDLVADGGGVASITTPLLAVMSFALLCGAIAWTRAKRLVTS